MNRLLPVTLVGGFLGAGKTSVLHHFISEHAAGPIAVLVEGPGGRGLDARAMKGLCGAMSRSRDVVYEIPALEELAQVDWLARKFEELSGRDDIQSVFIEVSGTSNAARIGRHFGPLPGQPAGLATGARLDRIICVVDAFDFYRGFEVLMRRGLTAPFLDFQHAQVAGASLLVLNKCDLIEEAERAACIELLRRINPHAGLLETAYGEIAAAIWSRPDAPQQLALAVSEPVSASNGEAADESNANDFPLSSMMYRVHRPFHPERFWTWFEADHPGLLRVKGLVWLATRNLLVGGISRTRWQSSCGGAGIWWAALPREEWPADHDSLERMQQTWREPWGDRRQELALVGDARALPEIARGLAGCLLSDDEFARPVSEWRVMPDPFPAWDVGESS